MTSLEIHTALSEFILSVSGWRKVFEQDGEQGSSGLVSQPDAFLVFLACKCFEKFLYSRGITEVVIGRDTRPTGCILVKLAEKTFTKSSVRIAGIAAAPEIMSHAAKTATPFVYFSASHNPIGHNGLKFGLTNGGVLDGDEANELIAMFCQTVSLFTPEFCSFEKTPQPFSEKECRAFENEFFALWKSITKNANPNGQTALAEKAEKEAALKNYAQFAIETISGTADTKTQEAFCTMLSNAITQYKSTSGNFCIVYDFNGSSRAHSIDKTLFEKFGLEAVILNEYTIAHGIIPEGDNLIPAAEKMRECAKSGKQPLFALMPDCDGDRGNLVFWDEKRMEPLILNAQEVFALSVLSELSYVRAANLTDKPIAIAVNGATSLRIVEIAKAFNARVFTAEVGEANVVNLALKLQSEGYFVRILGEGSNGGNITFPAKVRDPINTLFAILKLLVLRGDCSTSSPQNSAYKVPCIFRLWCEQSGQPEKYKPDFTLQDIIGTLPVYTTTATQEKRALLQIAQTDQVKLKQAYQKIFEREWTKKKATLFQNYGFATYKVFGTQGTDEFLCAQDFGASGKGGLKAVFYSEANEPLGFVWMRGSKTEPVFRVMAEIKGANPQAEIELAEWQGAMLKEADKLSAEKEPAKSQERESNP